MRATQAHVGPSTHSEKIATTIAKACAHVVVVFVEEEEEEKGGGVGRRMTTEGRRRGRGSRAETLLWRKSTEANNQEEKGGGAKREREEREDVSQNRTCTAGTRSRREKGGEGETHAHTGGAKMALSGIQTNRGPSSYAFL